MAIKRAAVIGAGTMGAGIAGQVANAGIEVLLLDLPSEGADVNLLAQRGKDRVSNLFNPGVISPKNGELITCLLYTSPSPRDGLLSRMPSSA